MSAVDSPCHGFMIGMAKWKDAYEQEIKSAVHGVQSISDGFPDRSALVLLQQVLMEILYLNTVDISSLPRQPPSLRRLHICRLLPTSETLL
jgi:rRNA processing protein Krr1/Pno1